MLNASQQQIRILVVNLQVETLDDLLLEFLILESLLLDFDDLRLTNKLLLALQDAGILHDRVKKLVNVAQVVPIADEQVLLLVEIKLQLAVVVHF